jgi:hypothetical protein
MKVEDRVDKINLKLDYLKNNLRNYEEKVD